MKLSWDKGIETGIPALDDQHRGIFNCINAFFDKCNQGGGVDELTALVDTLDDYTKKHFNYEECLQKINNYEGLKQQQAQHAFFLAEIAELKNNLEAHGASKELAVITKGKLIRWFSHHIKTLDKEFADFLEAKRH